MAGVGKKQNGKSVCGVCDEEVRERDKGVECDGCERWYHGKCVLMESKMYAVLSAAALAGDTGLHWFCSSCDQSFKECKVEIGEMKGRQKSLEDEMSRMREEWENWKRENGKETVLKVVEEREKKLEVEVLDQVVEKLKKEAEVTKREIQEGKVVAENVWKKALQKKEEDIKKSFAQAVKEDGEVKKSFIEIVKEQEEQWTVKVGKKEKEESRKNEASMRKDIRMEVAEEMEREKRKNNLVLFGVPEEGSEGLGRERIVEVIKGLVPEAEVEFVVVARIGRKESGAIRPVRIRVEDPGNRRKLLGRAKGLKSKEGMDKIYIAPDMTRVQQLDDRKLRDEVKRLRESGARGVRIEKGVVVVGDRSMEVNAGESTEIGVQGGDTV